MQEGASKNSSNIQNHLQTQIYSYFDMHWSCEPLMSKEACTSTSKPTHEKSNECFSSPKYLEYFICFDKREHGVLSKHAHPFPCPSMCKVSRVFHMLGILSFCPLVNVWAYMPWPCQEPFYLYKPIHNKAYGISP